MQANIIVMDEPSSALGNREIEQLFKTIEKMKAQGISVIYISHRLEELWQIADRVTVLRDGQYIATTDIDKLDKEQLIKQMVGRDLTEQFPERNVRIGEEMLRVENLSKAGVLKDVSFRVRRGEVCLLYTSRIHERQVFHQQQGQQSQSPGGPGPSGAGC